jgi:protein-L-isoaspartate(D-aspartate) O-methyltransferase
VKTADPVRRMLDTIRAHARECASLTGRPELEPQVLDALGRVPREAFVPRQLRAMAHADGPLPIGLGQTISQPFIVALMTDLIRAAACGRVLEVGTGCGYQTAVLAELAQQVFSLEIVPELAREAGERLHALGYANLQTRCADGYHGWPEQAPFDAILVAAAAPRVPPPLLEQLAPGGRMVLPVGGEIYAQQLLLVEKDDDGAVRERAVLPVAFVPFTGAH